MMGLPREDSTYSWTYHVVEKMQFYGISEGRIRRIIRHPARVEEGIAPATVVVMSPAGTKRYQEIWVMYKLVGGGQRAKTKSQIPNSKKPKIKVITAWRYPGKSPERDPVPAEVLREVQKLL